MNKKFEDINNYGTGGSNALELPMEEVYVDTEESSCIVPNFPLHITIEASGRCNLMCAQCFRFSRRTKIGDLDFSLFKKIVDEVSNYHVETINISWQGESFLHPEIFQMISYAKQKDIKEICIYTNGTLVSGHLQQIIDSGLDTIIFSVDFVSEEQHNRWKFGSDFRLVEENIKKLVSLRQEKQLNQPKVKIQIFSEIESIQSSEEINTFIQNWSGLVDDLIITRQCKPDGNPNLSKAKMELCKSLWEKIVVGWDGNVYACEGDNSCRMPLGNITNQNLFDIWHGEALNELRTLGDHRSFDHIEICKYCDLNVVNQ